MIHFISFFSNNFCFSDGGSDGNAGQGGASFSQRVREMSADSFLSCLAMCYEHVLLSLARAELFHRFIESSLLRLSVTDDSILEKTDKNGHIIGKLDSKLIEKESNSGIISGARDKGKEKELDTLVEISKGCLSAACELAQRSISQLLTLRKETTSKQLSLEKVYNSNISF